MQAQQQAREIGVVAALLVSAGCVVTVLILAARVARFTGTDGGGAGADLRLAIVVSAISTMLLVTTALTLSRRMEELRRAAQTDPLTGLLTRGAVATQLASLLRYSRHELEVAVLTLDLDGFKEVNDRCGHSVGDQVLVTIARRLESATNGICSIGRLGGDEFIVLATALRQPPHFDSTWKAVMHDLSKPINVDGEIIVLGASGGVSKQYVGDIKSPETMLHEADIALYAAKDAGGSQVLDYTATMKLQSARESERLLELTQAIDGDQFEVHFQPEIDLRDGQLVGAEALLRWNHPIEGLKVADAFIEDLERFNLLPSLLPMLFRQACSFAGHYDTAAEFTMRVNLAAEQLSDPRILPLMQDALDSTPGVSFCLEVTERSVLDASSESIDALRELRKIGVRIALDDFGTGYSSLKQLHDLPVDAIKIDRTFVDDLHDCMPDESIAAIIIDLGSLMDLEVIAEGIETSEQHRALAALGCTRGQGYLFGRPINRNAFLDSWPDNMRISEDIQIVDSPKLPRSAHA